MPRITQPQIDYLTRFRERLLEKLFLMNMLSQIDNRPTIELSKKRWDAFLASGGMTLHTLPDPVGRYEPQDPGDIFVVRSGEDRRFVYIDKHEGGSMKSISFPRGEHASISKRIEETGKLVTTRVSKEQGRYQVGDKLISDFGVLEVVSIETLTDVNDHPYISELTPDQIETIGEYGIYDVVHLVHKADEKVIISIKYLGQGRVPLEWEHTFQIEKGMLPGFERAAEITSVGRYLMNNGVFVEPFEKPIEYVNSLWKPGAIEELIVSHLIAGDCSVAEGKRSVNNVNFLDSLANICVMTATRKSFTTGKEVRDVVEKAMEENKGSLNDPRVAKNVENQGVEADKKWLGDDESRRFYDAMGSKSIGLHRKNMFVTQGGLPDFTEDDNDVVFIKRALIQGWDPKDFPDLVNQIRRGSFMRGNATQLGGALSKTMMRIFQNIEVMEYDCGTQKGLSVTLTEDNIGSYRLRWYIDSKGESRQIKEGDKSMTGKTVVMRGPEFCQTGNGLCKRCSGGLYEMTEQKAFSMVATRITTSFLNAPMKAIHGKTIKTFKVDPKRMLLR